MIKEKATRSEKYYYSRKTPYAGDAPLFYKIDCWAGLFRSLSGYLKLQGRCVNVRRSTFWSSPVMLYEDQAVSSFPLAVASATVNADISLCPHHTSRVVPHNIKPVWKIFALLTPQRAATSWVLMPPTLHINQSGRLPRSPTRLPLSPSLHPFPPLPE